MSARRNPRCSKKLTQGELRTVQERFISIASHKLLGPLTIIKWNVELLERDDSLSIKSRERIKAISENASRLSDFSNVLLEISGGYTGNLTKETQKLNVCEIIKGVIDELSSSLKAKGINLDYQTSNRKEYLFDFGPYCVRYVFRCVFENGLLYNKQKGSISIKVGEDKDRLVISVSDTGIGVPDGEGAMLFKPFYRATNAQKSNAKGYGLSLYLAKLILNKIGGDIWFKSKENEGSNFSFSLPISTSD